MSENLEIEKPKTGRKAGPAVTWPLYLVTIASIPLAPAYPDVAVISTIFGALARSWLLIILLLFIARRNDRQYNPTFAVQGVKRWTYELQIRLGLWLFQFFVAMIAGMEIALAWFVSWLGFSLLFGKHRWADHPIKGIFGALIAYTSILYFSGFGMTTIGPTSKVALAFSLMVALYRLYGILIENAKRSNFNRYAIWFGTSITVWVVLVAGFLLLAPHFIWVGLPTLFIGIFTSIMVFYGRANTEKLRIIRIGYLISSVLLGLSWFCVIRTPWLFDLLLG